MDTAGTRAKHNFRKFTNLSLLRSRTIIQYAPVSFGISVVGLVCVLSTKKLGVKLGEYFYVIIVPCLGYMCIMGVFMLVGSVGVGKLPTGLGETLFLFGAETGFGGFQVLQTSMSSIFSQVIPSEFIVSF